MPVGDNEISDYRDQYRHFEGNNEGLIQEGGNYCDVNNFAVSSIKIFNGLLNCLMEILPEGLRE